MARVLVADDESKLRRLVCDFLRRAGHETIETSTGKEALDIFNSDPRIELCLLDIMIPEIDGWELCRQIRKASSVPIILLTARSAEFDEITGFDAGADDYVTKPFNPVVLGAKVKALIRRSKGTLTGSDILLTAGPFQYNTSTLRFYKNGQEIVLSSKENAMMKLFMDNINRIFSRDMIYELIWGEAIVDENAIMVYINRLRQKIEDDPAKPKFIQTVRGLGYRFVV